MQLFPSIWCEGGFGFSLGAGQKTSITGVGDDYVTRDEHTVATDANLSDCEEQCGSKRRVERLKSRSDGDESGSVNKSKQKRNRRKERKKNKVKEHSFKVIGVNAAALMSKLQSFEKLLKDENPSVFCIQETKVKKVNQIKTDFSKNYTIYELLSKNSNGGGVCIGVQKDLKPVWVGQGDDEVEALAVEIWVDDFPLELLQHMDLK